MKTTASITISEEYLPPLLIEVLLATGEITEIDSIRWLSPYNLIAGKEPLYFTKRQFIILRDTMKHYKIPIPFEYEFYNKESIYYEEEEG